MKRENKNQEKKFPSDIVEKGFLSRIDFNVYLMFHTMPVNNDQTRKINERYSHLITN